MFFGSPASKQMHEWLAKEYVESVIKDAKKRNSLSTEICFLTGIRCALRELFDDNLRELISEELVKQALGTFNKNDLNHVKEKLGYMTAVEARHWNKLYDEIMKSKTFISRIKSVLRNIFNKKTKGNNHG